MALLLENFLEACNRSLTAATAAPECVRAGIGVPRNATNAELWYQSAFRYGHWRAPYSIALIYDAGEGEVQQATGNVGGRLACHG